MQRRQRKDALKAKALQDMYGNLPLFSTADTPQGFSRQVHTILQAHTLRNN